MGRWYAGVVHSHTNRSDGKFIPDELVKKAADKGLDFIIITDHNRFCEYIPENENILVIPGAELTNDDFGHTNIWGVQYPIDNFVCDTYDEWERKIAMAREKGATICINHPKCSMCGWRWPLEPEKADCVEVWNSPQHTDNMIATKWWQDELRKGKKIPAVGGSDYHRDYVVTDFLDNPTTYVYAEECTAQCILKAIREGHTTVSPKVNGQRIEIYCKDKIIGDTVKLSDDTVFTVSVNLMKKNQTLKIIGNEGVIFEYTSKKQMPYSVTLPMKEKGFVCAQIEYTMNPLVSRLYAYAEKKVLHSKNTGKLPPFIYSQTGAMYFE